MNRDIIDPLSCFAIGSKVSSGGMYLIDQNMTYVRALVLVFKKKKATLSNNFTKLSYHLKNLSNSKLSMFDVLTFSDIVYTRIFSHYVKYNGSMIYKFPLSGEKEGHKLFI